MTNHALIAVVLAATALGIMFAALLDEWKDRRR